MLKFLVHIVFIALLSLTGEHMQAQDADSLFVAANKSYQQENYMEALEFYQKIEKSDLQSAALYFNMGNIYYKTNQVAPAIYYYEKALKLAPNDKDIQFNLKFANRMMDQRLSFLSPKSLAKVYGWSYFKLHL